MEAAASVESMRDRGRKTHPDSVAKPVGRRLGNASAASDRRTQTIGRSDARRGWLLFRANAIVACTNSDGGVRPPDDRFEDFACALLDVVIGPVSIDAW